MYITKIRIQNFKRYYGWFELELRDGINIIVGKNEVGKSTIIEAVNLALSGFYQGRYVRNDISQYIFNKRSVDEYLESVKTDSPIEPPSVTIELYFNECPEMKGNHNSYKTEYTGLSFKICFDDTTYRDEYNSLLRLKDMTTLPVEYYHVVWRTFHRTDITSRMIPFKAALIDSSAQYQTTSDMYVSHIIKNKLDDADKVCITQSYRKAQQSFMSSTSIQNINKKLAEMAKIDGQEVSLSVDLSSRRSWEDALTAYMDKIPFHYIGKGGQCIIKTKLALAQKANIPEGIVLIEEPENHLSFGKLNELVKMISEQVEGRQLLVSTHSSFVLNKLGLSSLVLLSDTDSCRLDNLSPDTSNYFSKLAGYDTLRLLLCKRIILVEGDSDELVVQRAYKDKYGKLPIEDGVDVLCVRGLAFLRFLEIAKKLNLTVAVATDNDGNVDALKSKYQEYLGDNAVSNIKICFDETVDTAETLGSNDTDIPLPTDFNYNTLEPKMLKANSLDVFKKIFGAKYNTVTKMLRHLHATKSDSGLSFLTTTEVLVYPQYIIESITHGQDAVSQ